MFMSKMATDIKLDNAQRADRMVQINNAAENALTAQQAGIDSDLARTNASFENDIIKQNQEAQLRRDAFNATNAAQVLAADVAFRRNANTVNTAAANTMNYQNVQNAFQLTTMELAAFLQEQRDNATFVFQSEESGKTREHAVKMQILLGDINASLQSASRDGKNRSSFIDSWLNLFKPKAPPTTVINTGTVIN